jgi:hypothetical protein
MCFGPFSAKSGYRSKMTAVRKEVRAMRSLRKYNEITASVHDRNSALLHAFLAKKYYPRSKPISV